MTRNPADPSDPKTLIADCYAIERISDAECRAIFFDWALSLGPGQQVPEAAQALLRRHGAGRETHPMTQLLQEAAAGLPVPRRRGGRGGAARRGGLN